MFTNRVLTSVISNIRRCSQSWENFLTYPGSQGVMMDYVRLLLHSGIRLIPLSKARVPNFQCFGTFALFRRAHLSEHHSASPCTKNPNLLQSSTRVPSFQTLSRSPQPIFGLSSENGRTLQQIALNGSMVSATAPPSNASIH